MVEYIDNIRINDQTYKIGGEYFDDIWRNCTITLLNNVSIATKTYIEIPLTTFPVDWDTTCDYMLYVMGIATCSATDGHSVGLFVSNHYKTTCNRVCYDNNGYAAASHQIGHAYLPVHRNNFKIYVYNETNYTGSVTLYLRAYRRLARQ